MAGHSQFKNIMHRKGAQDKKKAKIFTKLNREIAVAVKSGGIDPDSNPRLRAALIAARSSNMPKDNVEKAIKKASGDDDGVVYEQITYEGYGIAGVAVIVECLTDNRNRSASDIRSTFSKFGGNLGASGSVSFMFEYCGIIKVDKTLTNFDSLLEYSIEAGAEDVLNEEDFFKVKTSSSELHKVNKYLTSKLNLKELPSEFDWIPTSVVVVNEEEKAMKLLKMLDTLEDNDDVQNVFSNFEIAEDILNKIS